ncbi:MAG: glycosyltransferase family 9 protein [Sulfurimonas sp.]|jgi:ADP-heptose:LPS heptosyltransferase
MNILVVRNDKLGDFITALPAIYVLKNYDRKNRIVVLVSPLNKALAESCEFIDEVIVDEKESSVFALASKIKESNIDASITLFSNTRVAVAQFLAGIKTRIAPATKIAQIFFNKKVVQRRSEVKMAEFEYNLQLAKVLFKDISLEFPKPLLHFDDAQEMYAKFCRENKIEKEVIAFHVGFGGSSDANWNLDEYEILIREVLAVDKYQVVLTFGPDEKELRQEMQRRLDREDVVFYLSTEGLVYFAKLISNFKLFVSTSTGTYHVANLVGCATMTFFGNSLFASAARWKSIGDEKLQQHYMLPIDEQKRLAIFAKVSQELISL